MRPLKLLSLSRLLDSFTDDNEEVLSQDKGNSLPLVPKLLLLMVQEVTKVNVEQLEEEKEKSEFGWIGLTGSAEGQLTCPFSFTMMLELCLSPIPRMNVATQ